MADLPRNLTASAEIVLSSPGAIMKRLCDHFAEHGEVTLEGRCGRIDTVFGSAGLEAGDTCLKLCAMGRDDTALAYVKLSLAEHILHFAATENPRIVWTGDGEAASRCPISARCGCSASPM
jgi:hypothetical protein